MVARAVRVTVIRRGVHRKRWYGETG
jgi:hypothetical protein